MVCILHQIKNIFNILIFKEYSFLQTQYLYSDGGLSDTGILVDLHNKNDSTVR
jgi:hypothetical protein